MPQSARWAPHAVPHHYTLQDAQKGRPARPQQAKGRIVLLRYGEPLSDARTPLADFFRILLEAHQVKSPALPRLATGVTGVGRLEWEKVYPLLQQALKDLNIPVYVYGLYKKGVAAQEA